MQATSTPTLAQPKSGAFAALGGAAILAAAVGVGAILGVNLASSGAATAGHDANVAAYALNVQRSGEVGALTPAQRGLLLQRQGEIGAANAQRVAPVEIMPKGELFTTPTGTTIYRIGGRDPMATFNSIGLSNGVSDHDLIRGSKGWYGYVPLVKATGSADDAFRAANGWVDPDITGTQRYPSVPFVPAADADGNTQPVGVSHR